MIFIIKSQVKNDPFIKAMGFHEITLSEMKEKTKAYRKEQARITRALNASGKGAATSTSKTEISYNTIDDDWMNITEIVSYKNVFYIEQSDLSRIKRCTYSNTNAFLTENLPTNSVVIVIRSTQKLEVLAKRIEKHSNAKLTLKPYEAWHKGEVEKAVKALTESDLRHVARQDDNTDASYVYDTIIGSIVAKKKCPIKTDRFNNLIAPFKVRSKINVERVDMIIAFANMYKIEVPEVSTDMEPILKTYPLLAYLSEGLQYSGTLADACNKDIAKGIYRMIEALDMLDEAPEGQKMVA